MFIAAFSSLSKTHQFRGSGIRIGGDTCRVSLCCFIVNLSTLLLRAIRHDVSLFAAVVTGDIGVAVSGVRVVGALASAVFLWPFLRGCLEFRER